VQILDANSFQPVGTIGDASILNGR